ncbi:MAG: arsenate reductase ArsC [Candidatus Zixiibacteriota bacterium]|nr:MAG: arsenate reductase ArsC [candidate division Zixibacteria bacterium]
MRKKRVLFLCTTNSCRSQMAEGILRAAGGNGFEADSAGAKPAFVHPLAAKVMAEAGIDISSQESKSVSQFQGLAFDYVITLCGDGARDVCPAFIGKMKHGLHWDFPDPAEAEGSEEEKLEVFRKVRDQIKARLEEFVKESGDE